ncbi:unnamed protein product [Rangifer tarandus platyrhynchus]|uniref:Uncharacterized protein n=1 Tax=Rangifer tarandus platyrhynchus TaxID=3082113 RepID=A0AC60A4R5_RANTA
MYPATPPQTSAQSGHLIQQHLSQRPRHHTVVYCMLTCSQEKSNEEDAPGLPLPVGPSPAAEATLGSDGSTARVLPLCPGNPCCSLVPVGTPHKGMAGARMALGVCPGSSFPATEERSWSQSRQGPGDLRCEGLDA